MFKQAPASILAIRAGLIDDLPALMRIELEAFSDPWSELSLEAALRDERTFVLVAHEGATLHGFGVAWAVLDEAEITHLAVAPSSRRRGMGRRLLGALCDECERRGARRIFLEVREGNLAARNLYERSGFSQAGLRPHYYGDGENAVVMQFTR